MSFGGLHLPLPRQIVLVVVPTSHHIMVGVSSSLTRDSCAADIDPLMSLLAAASVPLRLLQGRGPLRVSSARPLVPALLLALAALAFGPTLAGSLFWLRRPRDAAVSDDTRSQSAPAVL